MKVQIGTEIGIVATLALFLILGLTVAAVAQQPATPVVPIPDPAGLAQAVALENTPDITVTLSFTAYLPFVARIQLPKRYALQFDGVDDFASIADKGDFDFDQALTVEAWVKPQSIPPDGPEVGLVVGTESEPPIAWSVYHWGLQHGSWGDPTEAEFYVCCSEGGVAQSINTSPQVLQAGRWDHIAGSYKSGELAIYRNGVLERSRLKNVEVKAVSFVLLGMRDGAFHGLLDEVRIWNVARTQSEIQANMNRTLTGNEPGLVGYWRLDEGTGQAILDSSPYHNDGRLGPSAGADPQDPIWVESDAPVN